MNSGNSTNPAPVNLGVHGAGSVSENTDGDAGPSVTDQSIRRHTTTTPGASADWWDGYTAGYFDRGAEDAPLIAAAARGGEQAGRAGERRAIDAEYATPDTEHRDRVKEIGRGMDAVTARAAAAERARLSTYRGGPVDFFTGHHAQHGGGWAA